MGLLQTVLPFKLDVTDESLTAHGGQALHGEYLKAVNVAKTIDRELPPPGSAKGYAPSVHAIPLILMLSAADVRWKTCASSVRTRPYAGCCNLRSCRAATRRETGCAAWVRPMDLRACIASTGPCSSGLSRGTDGRPSRSTSIRERCARISMNTLEGGAVRETS